MSNIRVGYTGSIAFFIGIIRLILGFVFITVVTRILSPEEYGTWTLIGGLLVYVLILHYIETYWLTRETARNNDSGKTAIFSGGIFSSIGIVAYLLIATVVSLNSQVDMDVLLFAVILVPARFFYSILSAINYGWKPQSQSYGLIIIDIIKIPAVLLFVYYLDFGVIGVILSAFLGMLSSIVLHLVYGYNRLIGTFNYKFLKKWFKLSWLTLYPPLAGLIFSLDVTIFTIIIGTSEGLGYYGAAVVIGSLVTYGGLTFSAIYPKLLGSDNVDFIQSSITRLLYFIIPLSVIIILFSKPGLYVLNPIYVVIFPAAIILSLKFFTFTIFDTCNFILRGIEKVDVQESSSFKDYIKSKLFYVPTLQMIQQTIYASSLTIFLLLNHNLPIEDLIFYWATISLVTQLPFTIYISILVRKNISFKLEWKKISKYLCSSLIFVLIWHFSNDFLNYNSSLIDFLPWLLFFIGICVLSYVILTFIIDSSARQFINSIINEIKKS
tara:strand:+ start:3363 stop:4847 length:1485 start_codon:yes stop_codon:yes gene_type:complete